MFKSAKVSAFSLEGRLIGFVGETAKPKRLRLATAEGDRYIKLSKELRRSSLPESLTPGDWLKISGEQKYKYKTGELKLKADRVSLKARSPQEKAHSDACCCPQKQSLCDGLSKISLL